MAKKAVASLQKGAGRNHTKCIKMVKSENGYQFAEEMVLNDQVKDFFAKK
ncbi:MAG: DUF4295 domain-containing protein [Bacteroidales bacterium]|jgi:hypothetical protein|nr:DUF4295 domain-containing protein [Bacteroidales bacterium]